jgi:hypothetical protein
MPSELWWSTAKQQMAGTPDSVWPQLLCVHSADPHNFRFEFDVELPLLYTVAEYDVKGRILLIPIKGNGPLYGNWSTFSSLLYTVPGIVAFRLTRATALLSVVTVLLTTALHTDSNVAWPYITLTAVTAVTNRYIYISCNLCYHSCLCNFKT